MSETDRRGFIGTVGTVLAGVVVSGKLPVPTDQLDLEVDVGPQTMGRKELPFMAQGQRLVGRFLTSPNRGFPIRPPFENRGTVNCLDVEFTGQIVAPAGSSNVADYHSEAYNPNLKEREFIYRVSFEPQDITKLGGWHCDGGRVIATSADHVDVAVGWDAGSFRLTFEVR